MYPAPSLKVMRRTLAEHRTEIIGLLFAPPYTEVGGEVLAPRLGYLDGRSGEHIHFFCAGYGGYNFAADLEPITSMSYENGVVIPWGFSQRMFVKFVDELESETVWQYSGEADLLLTSADLTFQDCILFDIEAMLKDKVVDSPSRLFESIIRYARQRNDEASAIDLSDRTGVRLLGDAAMEGILNLIPKPLSSLWKNGVHYRIRNLSRGNQPLARKGV